MTQSSQTSRILAALLAAKGEEVSRAELSRIGSGKDNGWCASLSRRISDIRKLGHPVRCKKQTVEGQVQSRYYIVQF